MLKQIKICYRKIIDAQSSSAWEKYVFEDTYNEFLMQFQFYNADKKYLTFSQLINENKNAEKLHFLTGAAVTGYVNQLAGKIPDVQNTLGKIFLPFHNFRFEIIESHISDKSKHKVAVNFYSDEITWIDTIGDSMLLSLAGEIGEEEMPTETMKLQPFVSIFSIVR